MGFSKSGPYSAEEPPPEREFPDLLSNQTVSEERPVVRPPSHIPYTQPGQPLPRRYHRRPPAWPSIVLLGGVALIVGSLLGGWWTLSVQEPNNGGTVVFTFQLGSQYSASCSGGSDCAKVPTGSLSYDDHNLGGVGNLYEGALALTLGALVAGIGAAVLGLGSTLGYWSSRRHFLLTTLLILVTFGLLLGGTLSIAALQPSALAQQNGGIASDGSPSPASTFWGSCSGNGLASGICSTASGTITANWGADLGWYLALIASFVVLFGLILHLFSRPVRGAAMGTPTRAK
jgi:hypothetical protein